MKHIITNSKRYLSRIKNIRDSINLSQCLLENQARKIEIEDLSGHFTAHQVEAAPGRSPLALLVHGFLSDEECERLMAAAEQTGYESATRLYPPSYRNNLLLDFMDPQFAENCFGRMREFLPEQIATLRWPNKFTATPLVKGMEICAWKVHSLNPLWRFSQYRVNEFFRPHLDGHFCPAPGLESKISVTIYLNEGFGGGETTFYTDRSVQTVVTRVTPRRGTLALFDHDLWHDGSVVTRGSKTILRTDVVFELGNAQSVPISVEVEKTLQERDQLARRVMSQPKGDLDYSKPTELSPYNLLHHINYVFKILVANNGRLLSASRDKTIAEWDSAGNVDCSYKGHTRSVLCLTQLTSDHFVSGSRDWSLRVWRFGQPQAIAKEENAHDGNVLCLTNYDQQQKIFFSGGADGHIKIWQLVVQKLEHAKTNFEHHHDEKNFEHPDEKNFEHDDQKFEEVALENRATILAAHASWIYDLVIDHKTALLFSSSEDGTVKSWNLQDGGSLTPHHQFLVGAPVYCILQINESHIAVGDEKGSITILKFDQSQLTRFQEISHAHSRAVRSLVLLDGNRLASASEDGSIKIWDLANTSQPISTLAFHRNFVRTLSLLPNNRLISGAYDGRLKIWDFDLKNRS